jgi:beta-phosphoglucomutase-like phosphatase (HAD superfamily)
VLRTLRLPDATRACVLELDGVLADTAELHQTAWEETLTPLVAARGNGGAAFSHADHESFQADPYRGVEAFLARHGINLPLGWPSDPPRLKTVGGLCARKDEAVSELLRAGRVTTYLDAVGFVHATIHAGLRTAVASASVEPSEVLEAAGIADLFDAIVDGDDSQLAAARELGVDGPHAAVLTAAPDGVASGRAAEFGYVVGVDRDNQVGMLFEHGADVVVRDLQELVSAA